jgi:hypothetical protein
MNSGAGDATQLAPGYPIRTPWDHSSVDSSPRPIAASHVLHRLLMPRHPPSALDNLTTKMLASTVQFSNQQPTHNPTPPTSPTRKQDQQHDLAHTPAVWEARPYLATPASEPAPAHTRANPPQSLRKTTPAATATAGCSFRTQQGAHRRRPAAPPPSFPTTPPTPGGESGCGRTRRGGRCRPTALPVSPPSSTPDPPGPRGSIPSFDGWCSLERR